MNWIFITLLALAFADTSSTLVTRLTEASFHAFIQENPVAMVNFFAPGCRHCKALRPEYKKAAELAKERNVDAAFGNIDAVSQAAVAEKYDVDEYPTLKLFLDSTPIDYEGEREAEAILAFIKKEMGPSLVEITPDNAQTAIANGSLLVCQRN
eukprot:TRINITY_DN7792_c0_g4_i1.p2 TRINITY_DN7792_c0_g4~~TRINITY_DN7792_c0_g4_i1.p2  ORF type:complete len:153 (-),score=42.75 TRINITY_DN7792_c0_g4_i1:1043-1501(-)